MKKTGRKIALFIILIAGLITLGSSMVSTYNDEYKLVLQFGKVVRVIDTPALRSPLSRPPSPSPIMRWFTTWFPVK